MDVSEPTTVATDYALGTLSEVLGILLVRNNRTPHQTSISLWALAFIAAGLGSYLGGTYHGFQHALGPHTASLIWKATAIAMGIASFCLLAAAFTSAFPRRVRGWLIAAAAIKLVIYTAWMAGHDEFRFVIYDYGSTLLILLFLVTAERTHGAMGHRTFIAAGVLVSIAAALIQQSGVQLHRHFNHNDLMHVVQMAGVWLLFKGAARLRDYDAPDARRDA
jgi:hypothetical protein